MTIKINDRISLTEFRKTDKAALVKYLQDAVISRNTLTIPHPYTEKDAETWLKIVFEKYESIGDSTEFVVRNSDGELIGGIGRLVLKGINAHSDEIGYWLAKPFRGQGIMTEVVEKFTNHCFEYFPNLVRIEARVFSFNKGSVRVLEKAGFQKEGFLRKAYLKNGKLIDAYLFAKIKQ